MGKHTPAPTNCPADCWDWLTEDQFADLARHAYRYAQHLTYQPKGEPWIDPAWKGTRQPMGMRSWSNREAFAETLEEVLPGFLSVHCHALGLKGYAHKSKQHQSYLVNAGSPDLTGPHS